MKYYNNKYRTKSNRLKNWDYSKEGYYFVTICIAGHINMFGKIEDGRMIKNEMGKIVNSIWNLIPNQFNYSTLDEFIIMPNHLHGIIVLDDALRDSNNRVSTLVNEDLDKVENDSIIEKGVGGATKNHNPMLHNNLSRIVRWFKGRTTFEIRKKGNEFHWQPRFYDHIIRNKKDLNNIRWYIRKNPKMWESDKYNYK